MLYKPRKFRKLQIFVYPLSTRAHLTVPKGSQSLENLFENQPIEFQYHSQNIICIQFADIFHENILQQGVEPSPRIPLTVNSGKNANNICLSSAKYSSSVNVCNDDIFHISKDRLVNVRNTKHILKLKTLTGQCRQFQLLH